MTKHHSPKKLKYEHRLTDKNQDKDDRAIKYKCPYCNHEFKQIVGTFSTGSSSASSKVICPRCGNFLKTW